MRTDVRMRCFLPRHNLFWGGKNPSEHSCDSERELGWCGLSRLSAGIKHKAGFAKFPCADGMRGAAALWGAGCPHPPSHKAARHKSPASLCSPFPPHSPPVPRGLCWPFTERMEQQLRGFRATVATAPAPARPFPGDVPLPHGRSPALSAGRCGCSSGLCDLLCRMLAAPMCFFFVPAVTAAPSLQLHFRSGSHMFGLCGERGAAARLRR